MKTRIVLLLTLCTLLALTVTACGSRRANRINNQSAPVAAPTQPAPKAVEQQPTPASANPTPDTLKELSKDVDDLNGLLDGIDKDLKEMDTVEELK